MELLELTFLKFGQELYIHPCWIPSLERYFGVKLETEIETGILWVDAPLETSIRVFKSLKEEFRPTLVGTLHQVHLIDALRAACGQAPTGASHQASE